MYPAPRLPRMQTGGFCFLRRPCRGSQIDGDALARRTISTKEPRTGTRAQMGPNEFAPARIPLTRVEGNKVADDAKLKPMGIVDFAKAFPSAVPRVEDDPLVGVVTYNARCSECGSDTVPLDPLFPNEQRVCLKCIITKLSDPGYEPNEYEQLERECEEIELERDRLQDDISDCESQIVSLEQERSNLQDKVNDMEELNKTMHDSVDALQEQINGWSDDETALRNQIARLNLDVERWRSLALRKGK